MISYADSNKTSLILYIPQYSTLYVKVLKLKQEMFNPFSTFKNGQKKKTLGHETMQIGIKQINLLEEQDKLKEKLISLEEKIQKTKQAK